MTPPVGAGPAEVDLNAIAQRGHVNNMAEAWAIMQQTVSKSGGMCTSGDYKIAYALDAPDGWYEMKDGALTWRPPAPGETQHIESVVMDSLTGQVLPIAPTLEVVDAQGKVVQSQKLMFLWHPLADHYGANYSIPTAGTYTLHITSPAPDFARHDQSLGNRFTAPLDVTFPDVTITPKPPAPPSGGASEPTTPPSPPAGAGSSTSGTTPSEEQPTAPETPSDTGTSTPSTP
jgi:hypothetical protein